MSVSSVRTVTMGVAARSRCEYCVQTSDLHDHVLYGSMVGTSPVRRHRAENRANTGSRARARISCARARVNADKRQRYDLGTDEGLRPHRLPRRARPPWQAHLPHALDKRLSLPMRANGSACGEYQVLTGCCVHARYCSKCKLCICCVFGRERRQAQKNRVPTRLRSG